MLFSMSYKFYVSSPRTVCCDCVGLEKAAGKRKEGSKCSAQGMEKTGSFTFFPYSLSEIFETEAAIDGFAHFSL